MTLFLFIYTDLLTLRCKRQSSSTTQEAPTCQDTSDFLHQVADLLRIGQDMRGHLLRLPLLKYTTHSGARGTLLN